MGFRQIEYPGAVGIQFDIRQILQIMFLQSMSSRMGIHQLPLLVIDIDRHQIRPDTAKSLQCLPGTSAALCQILLDQTHDLLHISDVVRNGIGSLSHRLFTAGMCRLFHTSDIKRKKVKSGPQQKQGNQSHH